MRRGTVAALVAGLVFPAVAAGVPLTSYAPVGPSNGDTVLMVHGGAWGAGGHDVYEHTGHVAALTGAGFRVVSMDYAHADVPAQVRQVAGVARALGRRGRVFLWGDSAGGHLALVAAARVKVAGVVAVGAPTNLVSYRNRVVTGAHVRAVLRGAGAWRYSPLWAARSKRLRAPVLQVHCRQDPLVSFANQALPFHRAARGAFVPLKGSCHAYAPESVTAGLKFLSKHNKKTPRRATSGEGS